MTRCEARLGGLLLFAALAACATFSQPPRALPTADWTQGATVYLHWKAGEPAGDWRRNIERAAQTDFAAAGLRVSVAPAPGALDVSLSIADPSAEVAASRDGELLDDVSFKYDFMPCIGNFADPRCIAREMVARTLESPRVAAAMKKGRPAAPPAGGAGGLSGRLAVLELRNFAEGITPQNASYFTDVIRKETLRAAPQLDVITRENLLVLLQASGKELASCEGECEVDTGRRIGADLIASGEIQKVGTRFKISLRLHETKEGRLIASSIASGASVDELDDQLGQAARELFASAR